MASAVLRLIALSVPIAGLVLYFGFADRRATPPRRPAQTAAASPIGSTATTGGGSAVADPSTQPTAAPPDSASTLQERPGEPSVDRLLVGLLALAPCSVTATVDGGTPVDRQLQAGERAQFEARHEIVLTAGHPQDLSMTINGVEAKALGKGDDPATARLNLTNYKEFLAVQ